MTVLEALGLGVLQGLTEFLPVSSSGHLVLAEALIGLKSAGATFEIAVHLGTALAIVSVYWREVGVLLHAVPSFFRCLAAPEEFRRREPARMLGLLLLSALPAGFVGVVFKHELQGTFDRPELTGICLTITGLVLAATVFVRPGRSRPGMKSALGMGVAQMFAILPGISRSGSTIAAGLFAGVEREAVGRFAFLMALIPILGAAVLECRELEGSGFGAAPLLAGMAAAYVSGVAALLLLLRFLRRGRLVFFAPYCFLLGLLVLVFV